MKSTIKRLLAVILTLALVFSLTSCEIVFDILEIILIEQGGFGEYPGGNGENEPEEERDVEVLPDENREINSQNPYSDLHSGYNFIPGTGDKTVWKVENYYEIDRIFDYAIASGHETVSFEFGDMVDGFDNVPDFFSNGYLKNSHREMTHIKSYEYTYTETGATFFIDYDTDTASFVLPLTADNTYKNYKNGNMIIRDYLNGDSGRGADFDDFAINKNNAGTMAVYNSESLWWALEHNYLPVFPAKNTKAEAFYEEAKSILREIISDDMTDYEKTLAIFEYLVDRVYYDYDAYDAMGTTNSANNTCYFLEGVFEYNRAVCDGKSKAFVLLCRIEGIECVRDWGSSYNEGEAGHAWNYVKINGTWYMVDTTAGDAGTVFSGTGVKAEIVDYSYFLCPVNTYKKNAGYGDTCYIYSGIWDSLLSKNNNNASIANDYFGYDVNDDGYDFIINSYKELDYLVDSMFNATGEWIYVNYTLEVKAGVLISVNISSYVENAIDFDNVDFSLYDYTTKGYYLIVFTAKQ